MTKFRGLAVSAVLLTAALAQNQGRELPTEPGNKATGKTINIGLIASTTGELQPWGKASIKGVQLAVDEFNRAGGKNGRKVRLIIEDPASRPEGGQSAAKKLIDFDKVLAVLGEVASGITLPAAVVCQNSGVALVAIGATRADITMVGGAIFRACMNDDAQYTAAAVFVYRKLRLRRVAVMTDRGLPYSTWLSTGFRTVFMKLGGRISDEEFYITGATDFRQQLTKIKASKPDGMFCSGYYNEVGPLAEQKLALGMKIPMVGGDGWDSSALATSYHNALAGSYYMNHYHPRDPAARSFVAKFRKRYGEQPANVMTALGYDAAIVVLDAIKRTHSLDSASLIRTISKGNPVVGSMGKFSIGPDGNARRPAVVIKIVRGGFVPETHIAHTKI